LNPKKQITVIAIALLLTASAPAQAQAPLLSKEKKALHNPKEYARIAIKEYGWSHKHYGCLTRLWGKESAWNHKADNPTSSAFGIAQMLNEKSTSPMKQINNGLRYIEHRYGDPCAAWKFWQSRYWY
jgi:hypothetical protein